MTLSSPELNAPVEIDFSARGKYTFHIFQKRRGGLMKEMNMAVGTLILMGFIMLLGGVTYKLTGMNFMDPLVQKNQSFFTGANSCFIVALVIDRFA